MRLPLVVLTAVLSLLACLPLNSPGATGNNIYVSNFMFSPVLDSGTADRDDNLVVTFRWSDSASGIGHTIVWDSGPPPLPINNGLQYSGMYMVNLVPGRYFYHCSIHTNFGMYGVIDVVPFGTPTGESHLTDSRRPTPVLVTQPGPTAARESPRQAGRRSRPATS
jgi:hypothetical protein